jgi:hydroxyacyl-ACP dehydratase HTD2-like protein with hotdog domain
MTRRFADVTVGDVLPARQHTPTRVTLFLFGVAYWTSHRIHYDAEWARSEGYDDVLVTANLLSAYSAELLTEWAGDPGCLRSLEERNVAAAVAGDKLEITGRVAEVEPAPDGGLVRCDLRVFKQDGATVVEGRATLHLLD